MHAHASTILRLLAATLLFAASTAVAEDTPAEPAADAKAALAPPGDCAQPRGLAGNAQPSSFDVAGSPASRLVPAQVAAGLGPATPGPPPPPTPNPPTPSLCDEPAGCSPGGPIFIEPEPVPGLPPGAGSR
jgi:hypothetical protein